MTFIQWDGFIVNHFEHGQHHIRQMLIFQKNKQQHYMYNGNTSCCYYLNLSLTSKTKQKEFLSFSYNNSSFRKSHLTQIIFFFYFEWMSVSNTWKRISLLVFFRVVMWALSFLVCDEVWKNLSFQLLYFTCTP